MPWTEPTPRDHRCRFVAAARRTDEAGTARCARHGIAPKTGYKWLAGDAAEGPAGLHERSRRPDQGSAGLWPVPPRRRPAHDPAPRRSDPRRLAAARADQDVPAKLPLAEVASEAEWDRQFASTADRLTELADEAHAEYLAGRTEPLDADRL